MRSRARWESEFPVLEHRLANVTVAAQVRKSFALKSSPVASRRYAFTSAEPSPCEVPSASR